MNLPESYRIVSVESGVNVGITGPEDLISFRVVSAGSRSRDNGAGYELTGQVMCANGTVLDVSYTDHWDDDYDLEVTLDGEEVDDDGPWLDVVHERVEKVISAVATAGLVAEDMEETWQISLGWCPFAKEQPGPEELNLELDTFALLVYEAVRTELLEPIGTRPAYSYSEGWDGSCLITDAGDGYLDRYVGARSGCPDGDPALHEVIDLVNDLNDAAYQSDVRRFLQLMEQMCKAEAEFRHTYDD
jgi:hypothetical protein